MSEPKISQDGFSYTFRSYFEMSNDTDEIISEFGYNFIRAHLQLPKSSSQIERFPELQQLVGWAILTAFRLILGT
ncbi:hypothetical protein [Limnofasciculus baicalensis]|uniref:Uncharacterized protein n=1 Tax=Limnofasciculus baicalensis BBK-W-15 TaxID=2699891 RepID=A0AAE3KQB7_9CYAN|nr:hypothetical protein [Limnofasciculus baicalensis]MCP2727157.1 hypothetical protein [Limnofasciculus baicalensis BBK-W-15]